LNSGAVLHQFDPGYTAVSAKRTALGSGFTALCTAASSAPCSARRVAVGASSAVARPWRIACTAPRSFFSTTDTRAEALALPPSVEASSFSSEAERV
jgi:hypothetical protein